MIAAITSEAFQLFFATFAILMLPFAIPLLSAKLRARMGPKRVVITLVTLLVIVPAILAIIVPDFLESHWIALQHKSTKFYTGLAAACDSVLSQHPMGTNEAIWISVADPSLPMPIRNMHPLKIQVNSNRVWMLLDSDSHAGIALAWEPSWTNKNVWVLDISGDAPERVIYTTNRSATLDTTLDPRPKAN